MSHYSDLYDDEDERIRKEATTKHQNEIKELVMDLSLEELKHVKLLIHYRSHIVQMSYLLKNLTK